MEEIKPNIDHAKEHEKVTGTLVWYYCICKREVWLMARNISSDQDNELLDIGRFIHEHSYSRKEKELELENMKLDIIENINGTVIVEEIKKTSKFIESSKMQLLFYLYELDKKGIAAEGLLLFPEEKKRERVVLDEEKKSEIEAVIRDILSITSMERPPEPAKSHYCKSCAYAEFCWA
ncbi:MAG: CRISPR-associated protein Cas4 [Firmicutes bacterium]|nr:CRISPR-associated protein Cas4 [Bacillota bacterium]